MTATDGLVELLKHAQLIDLSQPLEEHMPNFPTHSKFFHTLWGSYWHGDRSLTYQLVMNEHNGTHVDAPAHFISDSNPEAHITVDQLSLKQLLGRGVRIDCRSFAVGQSLPRDFVTTWEATMGRSPGEILYCSTSAGTNVGRCARIISAMSLTGRV